MNWSPLDIAATIGTGGLYGGYKLISGGADASQQAAEEQLAAQQQQQQLVMGQIPGMMAAANPTAGELNNLDSQLSNAQRMYQMQFSKLQYDQQMYQQNPAAQQSIDLMNGKSAAVLGPLQTQIANQRQQLVNQLQQQYGPGYASSSAGIQALNQFDQNAQMTLTQAQQSAIGQMSGIALAGSQTMNNNMSQFASSMNQSAGTYGQLAGSLQTRQMQPYATAIGGIMGTNPAPYAGADQVSNITMGQFGQQIAGRAIGIGLGAALGGSGGSGGGGGGGYAGLSNGSTGFGNVSTPYSGNSSGNFWSSNPYSSNTP